MKCDDGAKERDKMILQRVVGRCKTMVIILFELSPEQLTERALRQ